MKFALPIFSLALTLTACGGGGGGTTGGGGSSTMPPTPTVIATPATLGGTVVSLAGPLSAAPSATPNASSTPAAGAPISGATVYLVASNAALGGIPTSPLAVATTAPNGAFTLTEPTPTQGSYGIIVVDGTSVTNAGVTDRGYTLAHGVVSAGTQPTFYLDTLTASEQAGFSAYNAARATAGLPVVVSDTAAQMLARLSTHLVDASGSCSVANVPNSFASFALSYASGATSIASEGGSTPYYSDWPSQIGLTAQQGVMYAGFNDMISGAPCPNLGGNNPNLPQNHFSEILVLQ